MFMGASRWRLRRDLTAATLLWPELDPVPRAFRHWCLNAHRSATIDSYAPQQETY